MSGDIRCASGRLTGFVLLGVQGTGHKVVSGVHCLHVWWFSLMT